MDMLSPEAAGGLELLGIPVAFLLFGLMLVGVAVLHRHTLAVSLSGLAVITSYQLAFATFDGTPGLRGLLDHLAHEWVVLSNLFALLVGFALLARHFEKSELPELLPRLLPDGWIGGLALLGLVFLMSGFLDNIAAAIVGATVAASVYRQQVHIGFLAAVVTAANAGGAGSVLGDTTTTMMWIEGVSPLQVVDAYLATAAAFVVFAVPAARLQHRHAPITRDAHAEVHVDRAHLGIVVFILVAAAATNLVINLYFTAWADAFPFLGAAVWLALLVAAPLRAPDWALVPSSAASSLFLLALVTSASMMPVEALPDPTWITTLALGFVSAVFDNIPLTKLALDQGGYDWGLLAYAVGYGGSLTWFGSSAGVAVAMIFPQARSVGAWLRHGWPIVLGYVVGFLVLLALLGWNPPQPL